MTNPNAIGSEFAELFKNFDHALKRFGYLQSAKTARAIWKKFASELGSQFFDDIKTSNVAATLINHPPRELMAKAMNLVVPFTLRRLGVETKLILRGATEKAAVLDQNLIALVVQAHHWFDHLGEGKIGSIRQIAERDGVDASEVGRAMQLAFLAPDIIEAVMAGHQPDDLTARRLRRVGKLPLDWGQQRRILGFSD